MYHISTNTTRYIVRTILPTLPGTYIVRTILPTLPGILYVPYIYQHYQVYCMYHISTNTTRYIVCTIYLPTLPGTLYVHCMVAGFLRALREPLDEKLFVE